MRFEIDNLVFMIWEGDGIRSWLRIIEKLPAGVELDLECGTWQYTDAAHPDYPSTEETYNIGHSDWKFRDITFWEPRFRSGPVAIFDRTKIMHLDHMVHIAEEITNANLAEI